MLQTAVEAAEADEVAEVAEAVDAEVADSRVAVVVDVDTRAAEAGSAAHPASAAPVRVRPGASPVRQPCRRDLRRAAGGRRLARGPAVRN